MRFFIMSDALLKRLPLFSVFSVLIVLIDPSLRPLASMFLSFYDLKKNKNKSIQFTDIVMLSM